MIFSRITAPKLSLPMTSLMRRWSFDAIGREHLRLENVPVPEPRPGEVLIKVAAVSLNYRDKMVIESGAGLPLRFPFVPASDMVGRVVSTGTGTSRFAEGDRVIANFIPHWIDGPSISTQRVYHATLGGILPGVLSEYLALPEDWLVHAPASLDDGEASTLPIAALTAWYALVELGGLKPGQTVLVQGTGGVALFGLQIAHALGAEVFVTSGSDDKLQRALQLGAHHGIKRDEDWVEAVHGLTNGRGIDHILEIAGGSHLGRSLEAVAGSGRISVIGVLEGFEVSGPAAPLLLKLVTVQGIGVGHRRALEDLVRAVDHLKLKPVIDSRHAFDALPAALDALDRGPFGKVVIDVAG